MMKKVDLHIHTLNSDGAFKTAEVLKMCEENNLEIISITDHDSVKSYYDIKNENLEFNGKIIPGVELSFNKNGSLYDVLGYGIDIDVMNEWLEKRYSKEALISNQKEILNDMKKLYKNLGIKFNEELDIIIGKKAEAYNLIKTSALDFEENREVAPELFAEMFYKKHHTNRESKYYINETRNLPTLKECIEIIHKAGGVSSLAHSGAYGFSVEQMTDFINYAVDHGVKALELKYNCHTPEQEELIMEIARKHDLLVTGGSDFHGGKVKPQVKLGVVFGQNNIDSKTLKNVLSAVKYFENK